MVARFFFFTLFLILVLGVSVVPKLGNEIKDYFLRTKSVFAATPVISDLAVDDISYSTVRIKWNSSVPATNIQVFYDSLTATVPFANSTQIKGSEARTDNGYSLGGLAPATTYNYYVCETSASNEEVCSSVNSFTTLIAPLDRFRNPTLPDAPELEPMPIINGQTFTVAADCSDLQSIMNTAAALSGSANHQILIDPATTCLGNYNMPDRAGTGWIVVRSSASDDDLPGEGVRVNDSYEEYMPTLTALGTAGGSAAAVLSNSNPTAKWRFVGIQFTSNEDSRTAVVWISGYNLASDIVFDRDIFYSIGDTQYGIIGTGQDVIVANSSLHIVRVGSLAIAVSLTSAQGFTLDNNYINAPGISVFSEEAPPGGSPGVSVVASDLKISRNLFAWDHDYIENSITRQHLEFKTGQRILVDGNTFTDEWTDGQTGNFTDAILLATAPPQGGTYNGINKTTDITITNNTFYNIAGGIAANGSATTYVGTDVAPLKRVLIRNNLFYNNSGFNGSSGHGTWGSPFHFGYAIEDIVLDHNTVFDPRGLGPWIIQWQVGPGSGLKVTNNILGQNYTNGHGGIARGADSEGLLPAIASGNASVMFNNITQSSPNTDPTLSVTNNLLLPGVIDTTSDSYYSDPSKSYSPASCTTYWSGLGTNTCAGSDATDTANEVFASVGFAGPYSTTTDFRLASNSPYKNSAEGGEDPGVDIDALLAAQATLQEDNTDPIDPVVPPPPSGGGGSSRSSHSSSGGSSNVPVPPLVVPSPVYTAPLFPNSTANINTSSLPLSSLYFYLNLYKGKENSEVLNLQKILVSEGFLSASSQTGYFGELTEAAVKSFQKKYGIATVSTPGYGEVGPATRSRLNAIVALATGGKAIAALPPPTPPSNLFISSRAWITKKLSINIKDPEVTLLQQFLIDQGLAKGTPTGFFGALTEESVRLFQKKYGIVSGGSALTTGFGVVGPKTREKINEMMGE